jgi:putative protease
VHKELVGLRVNTVEGKRLFPNEMPEDVRRGMTVFRNRDHAYMRLLEKDSAERKIPLTMMLFDTTEGFGLTVTDQAGYSATAECITEKQVAQNTEKAEASLRENLGKLGNTDFDLKDIHLNTTQTWFVPASIANNLRREAIEQLQQTRLLGYQRPPRKAAIDPPAIYPEDTLSYLANVYNKKARTFYEKHGVKLIAAAYEANKELDEVPLMITKHCLRFSHGLCPKEAKGVIGVQGTVTAEPMTLINGNDTFTLKFDCKPCEMHVMGKIRKPVLQMAQPQAVTFHAKRP